MISATTLDEFIQKGPETNTTDESAIAIRLSEFKKHLVQIDKQIAKLKTDAKGTPEKEPKSFCIFAEQRFKRAELLRLYPNTCTAIYPNTKDPLRIAALDYIKAMTMAHNALELIDPATLTQNPPSQLAYYGKAFTQLINIFEKNDKLLEALPEQAKQNFKKYWEDIKAAHTKEISPTQLVATDTKKSETESKATSVLIKPAAQSYSASNSRSYSCQFFKNVSTKELVFDGMVLGVFGATCYAWGPAAGFIWACTTALATYKVEELISQSPCRKKK